MVMVGVALGQISKMLQHWNETEVEEWYWRNMKHETCWKTWNKGTSRKPGDKNVGNAMREREIETRENATLETMDERLGWRWKKSHYSGRWGLNGFEDLVRRPWCIAGPSKKWMELWNRKSEKNPRALVFAISGLLPLGSPSQQLQDACQDGRREAFLSWYRCHEDGRMGGWDGSILSPPICTHMFQFWFGTQ